MESFAKANNTFVKYFPASTLMFCNIGVKGEGLYNLLSENKEFRNTVSIAKADEPPIVILIILTKSDI